MPNLSNFLSGIAENVVQQQIPHIPKSIKASVGVGAHNQTNDVVIVQELLNKVPANEGGLTPSEKLIEDGKCGPLTIAAIRKFQEFHKTVLRINPDGRVDPGGKTIGKLNEYGGYDVLPGTGTPQGGFPNIPDPKHIPGFQDIMDTLNAKHGPDTTDIPSVVPGQPNTPVTIKNSVGKDVKGKKATNAPEDVQKVQRLLNNVPVENGGNGGALAETSKCNGVDDATVKAIEKFQKTALTLDDGRVDSDGLTLWALNALSPNYSPKTDNSLREIIVRKALNYVGTVSIDGRVELLKTENEKQIRKGWEKQIEFYDVLEDKDKINFEKRSVEEVKFVKYEKKLIDGVIRDVDVRPFGNMSWCGIFATYVLREAGRLCDHSLKDVKWNLSGNSPQGGLKINTHSNPPLLKFITRPNMCPNIGDVLYFIKDDKGKDVHHHAILVDIIGDYIYTVNGNSLWQGILIKKQNINKMDGYYNVTP